MRAESQEILGVWFVEIPKERWFSSDPAFDVALRRRFEPLWRRAGEGRLADWPADPEDSLALVILLDQFPRNMFRGTGQAFATDEKAREVTKAAIARGFDLEMPPERRQFFYMPLMHSENLADQEHCVALMVERLGETDNGTVFARRHRAVIVRFGRFPARNRALGRQSSADEEKFLAENSLGF